MPNILVLPSLQTSLGTNTLITSPKKVIPTCPISDETFDLAPQTPSLTLTRHTFDPPSNTPHLAGPLTQINQLKMVQSRAARPVQHEYARTSSVTNMLTDLKMAHPPTAAHQHQNNNA